MTSPKTLLTARAIHPRKRLGQNFLCDPQAAEMIVRRAGLEAGETVVEIGAGTGALTVPAARRVSRLYAVETDPRLLELLEESLRDQGLTNVLIRHEDALQTDLRELAAETGRPLTVIGNLPYNISSQVLIQLIHQRKAVARAVLMFQQELADRLTAAPGGRDFGRLTVMLRYCADITPLARLKPDLFYPRPRVFSEVLAIRFKADTGLPPTEETLLFAIIKAAFGNRRKTIKNALLHQDLGLIPELCEAALKQAGIDDRARAETLDAQNYVALCQSYTALRKQSPA